MSPESESGAKRRDYHELILHAFFENYEVGNRVVYFTREELKAIEVALNLTVKNLGDVVYTFRYRRALPDEIQLLLAPHETWIIRGSGDAQYRFEAVEKSYAWIQPRSGMRTIKILDQTPGIIVSYAQGDEQALLAKIRYNRLLDIFSSKTTSSLQSHLRTKVAEVGQVEIDEIYVGVDRHGAQYVLPVQAKGQKDNHHNIVQIEQDVAVCRAHPKFSQAICLPIAASFLPDSIIALMSFSVDGDGVARILDEKHYHLVSPDEMTDEDRIEYQIAAAS
jgi:hypothetical protein